MNQRHSLEAFYDGDCRLCLREVNWIRRLDREGRILFTDIADPQFDAAELGKRHDELMAEMHARLPNGEWITSVEVFRRLYAAVGFGWLVWPTRLPVVSQLLDVAYRLFAKNRLKLTGCCHPDNDLCKADYESSEVTS